MQTRGQITVPKKFRDRLGIQSNTPVEMLLVEDGILLKPQVMVQKNSAGYVIPPRISKGEYKKVLKKYEESKVVLWTKKDDKFMEMLKKKDEKRWKRLNW